MVLLSGSRVEDVGSNPAAEMKIFQSCDSRSDRFCVRFHKFRYLNSMKILAKVGVIRPI